MLSLMKVLTFFKAFVVLRFPVFPVVLLCLTHWVCRWSLFLVWEGDKFCHCLQTVDEFCLLSLKMYKFEKYFVFIFMPCLSPPGGDPGGWLSGYGAEEHRGVLPSVEGDWLRGQKGGSCRRCEQLIDHNTRSLSLSPTLLLCVYLRLQRQKNNSKESWIEELKSLEGWKSK